MIIFCNFRTQFNMIYLCFVVIVQEKLDEHFDVKINSFFQLIFFIGIVGLKINFLLFSLPVAV